MRRISVDSAKTVSLLVLFLMMGAATIEAKTNVSEQPFGKMPDGTPVDIYKLSEGPI